MSQSDPINGTPPPGDPVPRRARLKGLVPPWIATVLALVVATVTVTLHIAGLAEKTDVEALEKKLAMAEDRLKAHDRAHASQAAVNDYAECIAGHFEQLEDFSIELVKWTDEHSRIAVELFGVYENARDELRNYQEWVRRGYNRLSKRDRYPSSPVRPDVPLEDHDEQFERLRKLRENFAIDSQKCVVKLGRAD